MDLHLSKEIIKYSDNDVQRDLVIKGRYDRKIKLLMKYLENHLPINKVTKKHTFDFSKLKFDEGKNYDWFFLVSDNVKLLVRQYRQHFTVFANNKKEMDYFNKTSVFTISTDFDLVERSPENDKLSDRHCDNPFMTFQDLLPQIFEKVEKDEVHTIWNSLCFITPKHTKAKPAFIGDESVYDLNNIVFAMDEISSKYAQCFAQNEVLDRLKKLNVGEPFGTAYTISMINTDVKDDYYHSVGLKYYRNDDPTKKETWSDVYSLSRYYFDELFYSNHRENINKFIYEHHNEVFEEVFNELKQNPLFFGDIIHITYYKKMCELYSKENEPIEIKQFITLISKDYNKYLYYTYMRRKKEFENK